jgi:glycosyltransferase involved in cell wall biosynthesis
MTIGINGQRLLVKDPAGPEIYTYNLIHALAKTDQENKYTVYFNQKPSDEYWTKLAAQNPNFSYKVVARLLSWTQVSLAWELLTNPVDVFFTAVHTMPILRRPFIKTVAMIHGLEYRFSKEYKNPIKRLFIGKPEWYVAKYSDAVIVPSEFSKNQILNSWPSISEGKITVVPEGVSRDFYKRNAKEIEAVKEKYHLSGKDYLLFVSTIQPRKNLPKLVESFALTINENKKALYLAVAGKKGWLYEESIEAPQKYGIKDRVLFLDRVPTKDLPALYSGARAFVSTSLEEGFGLPLLEAMACETPCIVSDIQAFRQVGSDSVWYADPSDSQDVKTKLNALINGEYSPDLVSRAKERALLYTWEQSAQKTLAVLN